MNRDRIRKTIPTPVLFVTIAVLLLLSACLFLDGSSAQTEPDRQLALIVQKAPSDRLIPYRLNAISPNYGMIGRP